MVFFETRTPSVQTKCYRIGRTQGILTSHGVSLSFFALLLKKIT